MSRRTIAIIALLAIAAAWGATFTLVKHVLEKIAPETFIFWRFTFAGLILLAIAASRKRLTRAMIRPGVALGSLVFLGYWLQTHGLMLISPSRSALLTGLYVVMVPFVESASGRRRVSREAWIGSVLAVVGTVTLIGGFGRGVLWGDVMTIVCAVAFTLHVVLSAGYSTAHSATGLAAVQVLFVGLAAGIPSLFNPPTKVTTEIVVVIVFTAVVTTALAFAALMWGQAHISATEAAVILSFEPVAAAITSVVWDGEPLTIRFVAGGALIVTAMIVSQLQTGTSGSSTMPADGANPRHQ